jgi:hypothetical protein
MGRWAQRTRGSGSAPGILSMQSVSINGSGSDAIFVTYQGAISAVLFNEADFSSAPSGAVGIAVSQLTPNSIRVDMDISALGDSTFTYSGSLPAVVHPQTISY